MFGKLCRTCRSVRGSVLNHVDILAPDLQKAVVAAFPAVGRVATSHNMQRVLVYAKPKMMHFLKGSRLLVFEVKNAEYTLIKENPEFSIS
jgi:hypothetical protein